MKSKVWCFVSGVLLVTGSVAAHAAQFGDYLYYVMGTEVAIAQYIGSGSTVSIPETLEGLPVTSILTNAFRDCPSVRSVTIPDSVAAINGGAFNFCASLESVSIGNGLTTIGPRAFGGCVSLRSITIPNSATSVGEDAFSWCGALTNVTLGNGLSRIADRTFSGCSSLTTVTIPDSVTSVGSGAFEGCTGLAGVTISGSVISGSMASMLREAFSGSRNLATLTISRSVANIEPGAFCGWSSLTAIEVDRQNPAYSSLESVLYNENQDTLIQCPSGRAGSYFIPNGVVAIGDLAFGQCARLTDVISIAGKVTGS
jgi:hypothetical protein